MVTAIARLQSCTASRQSMRQDMSLQPSLVPSACIFRAPVKLGKCTRSTRRVRRIGIVSVRAEGSIKEGDLVSHLSSIWITLGIRRSCVLVSVATCDCCCDSLKLCLPLFSRSKDWRRPSEQTSIWASSAAETQRSTIKLPFLQQLSCETSHPDLSLILGVPEVTSGWTVIACVFCAESVVSKNQSFLL